MKRVLLLTTLAAMLAASMALSGVAQAKPIGDSADAKCAKLAIKTLGASFNPANYTFIGGTEGNDTLTGQATDGPDVFCGFGGVDVIEGTLDEDDVFLGGDGNDVVFTNNGTFYGGAGDDSVYYNSGTFYGEEGNDQVDANYYPSTFYGGAGDDSVNYNSGTFYGEEGNDQISWLNSFDGIFYGGEGDDHVWENNGGIFYGEEGNDSVSHDYGVFIQ